MSASRKLLALALMAIAIALLYPGVTQPVLTLSGTIEKSDISALSIDLLVGDSGDSQARQMLTSLSTMMGLDRVEGQLEAYRSTRSIWDTARQLAETGNLLVAILIVLFSVVIPVFKLLLQAISLLPPAQAFSRHLLWLNARLSKWSMADVFVMALLVAYMAGSAAGKTGDLLTMNAQLEAGFYYFLAYCVFSIASATLLIPEQRASTEAAGHGSS